MRGDEFIHARGLREAAAWVDINATGVTERVVPPHDLRDDDDQTW